MKWQWIVKGIAFGLLFVGATTFATMLLWNNLAVSLLGWPVISFFQALGLMILGRLLTGGFGPRGWGGRHGGMRGQHMRERWQKMSPEQREHFKQRWGGKGGWGPMSGGASSEENQGTAL